MPPSETPQPQTSLAHEQIIQQSRFFESILSSHADFAYAFDRQGRFTYANPALLLRWQKGMADVVGKTHFELGYPSALAARYQQEIRQVLETGQTFRGESLLKGTDDEPRFFEYLFVPVFDSDGQVESVAGSARDITERKQADATLRFATRPQGGGQVTVTFALPHDGE